MGDKTWLPTTLRDFIDVKHGYAFEGDSFSEEPTSDILLTPGNFAVGGGFKDDKFKYYVGPVPDEYVLQPGDLILTMTDLSKESDTLGFPAIVPASKGNRYLHNQRLGKVNILNEKELDKLYLYYLLRTREYRHEILASASGSVIKHTSPERIKKFRFLRPALPEQRAIAHILGTLDDKIEVNRRMNRTLEGMAQALFKQWFVDGAEPGWDVGTLGDIAENIRRGAQPSEIEPDTPYIGLEHMPRRSISLTEWGQAAEVMSNKFWFKRGEILFGKLRPYFHKVGVAPINGVCSTDILVIAPKTPEWFGLSLAHLSSDALIAHTNTSSTGTKMPRTNWEDIARYGILVPPIDVARAFNQQILTGVEKIRVNIFQSRTLATLRDALLPKLISGELQVKDAETFIGKVA